MELRDLIPETESRWISLACSAGSTGPCLFSSSSRSSLRATCCPVCASGALWRSAGIRNSYLNSMTPATDARESAPLCVSSLLAYAQRFRCPPSFDQPQPSGAVLIRSRTRAGVMNADLAPSHLIASAIRDAEALDTTIAVHFPQWGHAHPASISTHGLVGLPRVCVVQRSSRHVARAPPRQTLTRRRLALDKRDGLQRSQPNRVQLGLYTDLYTCILIFVTRPPTPAADRAFGRALGRHVATERSSRGISGGDLAAQSGVSLDAIRSLETGRTPSPGFLLVTRLSRALNTSLDDLATEALRAASGSSEETPS